LFVIHGEETQSSSCSPIQIAGHEDGPDPIGVAASYFRVILHGFRGRILVAENKNTLLRSHHSFGWSSANNSFQLKCNP